MEEIDFTKLLKNFVNNEFYSPMIGRCILKEIKEDGLILERDSTSIKLRKDGTFSENGELMIFPSDAQDWDVWSFINQDKIYEPIYSVSVLVNKTVDGINDEYRGEYTLKTSNLEDSLKLAGELRKIMDRWAHYKSNKNGEF